MRLWHKDLIPVLPREQLVAQWRDCSAIAGVIQKFVLDYPPNDFISYSFYVRKEMTRRGYKTMDSVWNKIINIADDYNIIPLNEIYVKKMDNIYLEICCYNLYEKYLCGGISQEDWSKINELWNR